VLAELDEFGDSFTKHTGIEFSEGLRRAMATYVAELYKWNDRAALLSKKDEARVVERHVMDSLSLLAFLHERDGTSVLDIGTGAGFPGLPLKIAAPELELTLVESVRKKWLFLNYIVEKLGLKGVTVIPERAESDPWRATHPEGFDVVTSRATYQLPELIPLAARAVKRGGLLVAYKGGRYEDELERAASALSKTSLRLVTVWESPWGPGRLLAFQRS
jgi:16S rRNA (guanine527-N7)-methyltransferase